MSNPDGGSKMSYVNAKIPKDLAKRIDSFVREGGMGYRNRGEFIVEAVREKIREISKGIPKEHEVSR